jgi:uncharacterized membrane protein YiaA
MSNSNENKKISYLWTIPITLFFPIIQIAIYCMRFGITKDMSKFQLFIESGYFIPMGLLSGFVLIYYLQKSNNRVEKIGIIIGYIFIIPLAILMSISSGLLMHPILGITLFGAIPLISGILIGYYISSFIMRKKTNIV